MSSDAVISAILAISEAPRPAEEAPPEAPPEVEEAPPPEVEEAPPPEVEEATGEAPPVFVGVFFSNSFNCFGGSSSDSDASDIIICQWYINDDFILITYLILMTNLLQMTRAGVPSFVFNSFRRFPSPAN